MSEHTIIEMIGQTFATVTSGPAALVFTTRDGRSIKFEHQQECCESVWLDDIVGDLEDLIGRVIVEATKNTGYSEDTAIAWTFYRFSTVAGTVTVAWKGEDPSGCYSLDVDTIQDLGYATREEEEATDYWPWLL